MKLNKRIYIPLILLAVAIGLLYFLGSYDITGSAVYAGTPGAVSLSMQDPLPINNNAKQEIEDANVYLSGEPETLYMSQYVYFEINSKKYTGDIDVIWGFDTANARPTSAHLYKPRSVSFNDSTTQLFTDVNKFPITTDPCEVGNEYNIYKRKVTYINYMKSPIDTSTTVVCFDSYTNIGNNYTVIWNTTLSKNEDWLDISSGAQVIDYNYDGMNKWYVFKNVPVTAGTLYKVRIYVEVPPGSTGKYDFAVKPSSETVAQAIANGHLYLLDPLWNTNDNSGFDLGTYSDTNYNVVDSAVVLDDVGGVYDTSGNYLSQIFNAESIAKWDNITWNWNFNGSYVSQALLDNQAATEVDQYGVDMTNNGLLLHMDNDWTDDSGNGRNGVPTGATFMTPSKFGSNAGSFDGTNDHVITADMPDNGDITISLWFNEPAHAGSKVILDKGGAVTSWYLYTNADRHLSAFFANTPFVSAAGTYNFDEWTHVIMRNDGTNFELYINGLLKKQVASVAITTDNNNVWFGENQGSAFDYAGYIDEVAIWNRALSDEEILNVYKRGALKLNVSVRSCDDALCAGESWNDSLTTSPETLTANDNLYFQYKTWLETNYTSITPELYNVTISYENYPLVSEESITSGLISGDTATIQANITDYGFEGIDTVWVSVNDTDNIETNYTLAQVGATDYWNVGVVVNKIGVWNYKIYANDTNNNLNDTSSWTPFTVESVPLVNEETITSSLTPGATATVQANITDYGGGTIDTVWMSVNDTTNIKTNYTMTQIGATDYWSTTLTVNQAGTWYYKVYANDTVGNLNDTADWIPFTVSALPAAVQETKESPSASKGNVEISGELTIPSSGTTSAVIVGSIKIKLVDKSIHTITIKSIDVTNGEVTFNIMSELQVVTLKLNESKKLDINKNDYYDTELTLREIRGTDRVWMDITGLNDKENKIMLESAPAEVKASKSSFKLLDLIVMIITFLAMVTLVLILKFGPSKKKINTEISEIKMDMYLKNKAGLHPKLLQRHREESNEKLKKLHERLNKP